ncbi:MAG: pyrimidine reductase family protein [Egibacteraceae bacterium]
MRQLFPVPVDPVDPVTVYGDVPRANGRPWVRLNMIASIDGATAVAGRSGGLGGPADRRLYVMLRSLADIILVGAGTVRAEGYGPASLPSALQDARRQRGQASVPAIAVVSRSCKLDWRSAFFTAATVRPMVVTVADAPAERRARAAEVADVVLAGKGDVELARALDAIAERGARAVLAEGGPNLNDQLASAGLLDELVLTLSPRLVGGDAKRILAGPTLAGPLDVQLCSVCEEDGFLFLRLRPC